MLSTFGSRRLVVGARYGLIDWLVQRVTAVLMAVFTLVVLGRLLLPGQIDYAQWVQIFSGRWMRAMTFAFVIALVWHAWVGMRDILMDYVRGAGTRLVLHVVSIVWLVGCAGWAFDVLWRLR